MKEQFLKTTGLYMNDLNLLKVFDTMMQTHSVSRTAESLHKTSSAISQSLSKLRAEYNNEELFVKVDRSLRPTQFAYELHEHIKNSLYILNNSTNRAKTFDPLTSSRKFTIGSHTLFDNLYILKLREKIKTLSPNISLCVSNLVIGQDNEEDILRSRNVDAIIGANGITSSSFNAKELDSFDVKIICSKEHPRIKDSITIDEFMQEEHAIWVNTGAYNEHLNHKFDKERKIVYHSNSFFNVSHLVANSDVISFFSERMLEAYGTLDRFKIIEPPFETPEIRLNLSWHKRLDNDAGFLWFKNLIEEVFEETKK